MPDVDPRIFAEALKEWRAAQHGHKSFVAAKWIEVLGISQATFHRKVKSLEIQESRSRRSDHGRRKDPRVDEWARIIVQVMGFVPKTIRKPPIKLALKKALINGMLPPEAEGVPYSTYCRIIREKGLLEVSQKIVRFEASRPMEMWQMDASGSEHLYVAKITSNGPVLRLRATKQDYKNKLQDGLKVWYYGMVDDFSGYWLSRVYIAPGESSADNLAFFKWCACKKIDQRIPFYGLPETVYMDNGPLSRANTTREFFKRVDVELKTHEPNSPEDTGKIEVRWKPLWRMFEMDLLMDPHWEKIEMTPEELNERLLNFIVDENQRAHRHLDCTRLDAWLTVAKSGGVVEISPEAWDTVFVTKKVLVDRAGWFDFEGVKYQINGFIDGWARAYKGVLDGKIIVKELRTSRTFEAQEAQYLPAGEFRKERKQEWEKVKNEAEAMKERFAPGDFRGVYEGRESVNVRYLVKSTDRPVETDFAKVDPYEEKDRAAAIPSKIDAMECPRPAKSTIPMWKFLKDLKNIITITPELNRELKERYGESIDVKEAEEVIRRISEGETGAELKQVSM